MTEHTHVDLSNLSNFDLFMASNYMVFILIAILAFMFGGVALCASGISKKYGTPLDLLIATLVFVIGMGLFISFGTISNHAQAKVEQQSRKQVVKLLADKGLEPVCDKKTTDVMNAYICAGDNKEHNKLTDSETGEEFDLTIDEITLTHYKNKSSSDIKIKYTIE